MKLEELRRQHLELLERERQLLDEYKKRLDKHQAKKGLRKRLKEEVKQLVVDDVVLARVK